MVKLLLMKPSLQKLQKFLKLEADRGYDNRAVLGGLERMLSPWEAEARVDQIPEDFIQAVVSRLHDYQRLSPKSRAEALQGLYRRIQREANINLPPCLLPLLKSYLRRCYLTNPRERPKSGERPTKKLIY